MKNKNDFKKLYKYNLIYIYKYNLLYNNIRK